MDHAIAELTERGDDAAVLAGGQSLIALMNLRLATPAALVDIARIPDLDSISIDGDVLRLGATVRALRCERDEEVFTAIPVLRQAIGNVGHPQIRSRTTIGGNIAHADPASELPAVLVGLDGHVSLASAGGTRTVMAGDFFEGMWSAAKRSDELLTSVVFPIHAGLRCGFEEFARRRGDFALAGAFVGVRFDGETIASCRVSLCGVADTPVRVTEAERSLVGLSAATALEQIAGLVRDALEPDDSSECSAAYRRQIAGTVARRALKSALDGIDATNVREAS